jgi:hypothetical protein
LRLKLAKGQARGVGYLFVYKELFTNFGRYIRQRAPASHAQLLGNMVMRQRMDSKNRVSFEDVCCREVGVSCLASLWVSLNLRARSEAWVIILD